MQMRKAPVGKLSAIVAARRVKVHLLLNKLSLKTKNRLRQVHPMKKKSKKRTSEVSHHPPLNIRILLLQSMPSLKVLRKQQCPQPQNLAIPILSKETDNFQLNKQ